MARNKKRDSKAIVARRNRRRRARAQGIDTQCQHIIEVTGERCTQGRTEVRIKGKLYLAKQCRAHLDPKVAKAAGVLTSRQSLDKARAEGKKGGRPPTKPHIILRKMVEENVEQWIQPYIDALQATKPVVVGNGPTAHVELLADDRARMQAAGEVFDRVYGKPKQTVEGTFDIEATQTVEVPNDANREAEVARILADSGALSMTHIVSQANNPVNRN